MTEEHAAQNPTGQPNQPETTPALDLANDLFEIGGTDHLDEHRQKAKGRRPDDSSSDPWQDAIREAKARIGTLLKANNVAFLLGAGTSRSAGGILLSNIPSELETDILTRATTIRAVSKWLKFFYKTISYLSTDPATIPTDTKSILARRENTARPPLKVNLERMLSQLWTWRKALPGDKARLRIDPKPRIEATAKLLNECIDKTTDSLVRLCRLPTEPHAKTGLDTHKSFLQRILTRPLSLKRINIFTLNYDTLIEQAADAEGIVLIDGFVGTNQRVFRPESYDHDLYFPAETTEGRVHRLDRVIHLYKLHGSTTWHEQPSSIDNPYGIGQHQEGTTDHGIALIYPTPTKAEESLGIPYGELFRRFASAVVRPQTAIFVIGYAFGDDHVNTIIRQALAIPSVTIVVIDPEPSPKDKDSPNMFARLRARNDPRVWTFAGKNLGTFSGFVNNVLPDLNDEEIQRQVIKTINALAPKTSLRTSPVPEDNDA